MGIGDKLIKFSIKKNLEKWVKGGAKAAVAAGAVYLAKEQGVALSDEQQVALTTAIAAAVFGFANLLKTKFPTRFGWL